MRPTVGTPSHTGRTASGHQPERRGPLHPTRATTGRRAAHPTPAGDVRTIAARLRASIRNRSERLLRPQPRVALWGGRSGDFQYGSPEDLLREDLRRRHPDLQLQSDAPQWRAGLERLLADVKLAQADHDTLVELDAELERRRPPHRDWASALDVDLFGGDWPL